MGCSEVAIKYLSVSSLVPSESYILKYNERITNEENKSIRAIKGLQQL